MMHIPENKSTNEQDIFRPLRDSRSPLSMNAIKNYILERVESITIWQRLHHILFQSGMIVIAGGIICFHNSPAGEIGGAMTQHKILTHEVPVIEPSAIKENKS